MIASVDNEIAQADVAIAQANEEISQLEIELKESIAIRNKLVAESEAYNRTLAEYENAIQRKTKELAAINLQFENAVKTEREDIEARLKANPNDVATKADLIELEKLVGEHLTSYPNNCLVQKDSPK
jgi:F0F1-type ATP synthase membrane subunit b/b'